jgi:hypothetical protein
MTYRRMTLTSLMRSRGALVIGLIVSVTACASKPIVAPPPKEVEGVSDTVLQPLSYLQLNAAANVFRVAFDRSLDSWQGAVDEAGLKCAISGPMAERALAALRPWLDQRAAEEATKLTDNPQSYKMPASAESCARDCSCVASLRILEAVPEDNWKKSSFKNWRKIRQRLEQLAEVESPEQVEICAESQNWLCTSELYKSLVSAEPKAASGPASGPKSGPAPAAAPVPKSGRSGR